MTRFAWIALTALAAQLVLAEPPAAADLELVKRTRIALADVRAFERLNETVIKLCHEPVAGSYADWRDDWQADLQRARDLAQALERRLPRDPQGEPSIEASLRPFTGAEGQVLYPECLRWGTALIQHESRVRADMAARFASLKDDEPQLRKILADDAAWQAWLTAGALR